MLPHNIITRRWNKIIAIPSILETVDTPYLAFIDADLVILDHDFDVYEDVIAQHPLADLILTEDVIGTKYVYEFKSLYACMYVCIALLTS